MRARILSARQALLRHRWAAQVIETRTMPSPAVLAYMDQMVGLFRGGGFSIDLTHHALHAMGSRLLGFSQELFDDTATMDPEEEAAMFAGLADTHPSLFEPYLSATHDDVTIVGGGCDDQFEFEFALDLLLDGLVRLRDREAVAEAQGRPV